ncbi:Inositol monophosphatase family protein [Tritrichomonas foetus]|uniref:Inositol-1-monophosphatase n=1 Tax=Tritrichomonas foetus TaxID=1144522 RepID=A0A1J4KU29_9EUKA|nr:Inositol monophosphatase family protein [Tritrichomonas foetus]|eukprot:OHT13268.1 Inositol monophosphatase family protein [Tritrichomonas foetus]
MNFEQIRDTLKEIARGSGAILMKYFESDNLNEGTKATDADIVTDADLASDKYIREQFSKHFPDFGVITEEGKSIPPKNPGPDELWLCADPLDGTTNFSCNLPIFSVSLACLDVNYEPVVGVIYDPTRDELFWAIKGKGSFIESPRVNKQLKARENTELLKCLVVTGFNPSHLTSDDNNLREITTILPHVRCLRRLGSACLDFCNVASARLDCYWEKGPHIWDVAAGWLIATEAGCVVSHYDGRPFTRESLMAPMIDVIVATPAVHKQISALIMEARKGL